MTTRRQLLAPLALLLASGSFVQAGSTADRFAGEWLGEYKGDVYLLLRLENRGRLRGSLGALQTGQEGLSLPLRGIRLNRTSLTFHCVDSDHEVDAYELTLTGDRTAQLRVLNAPNSPKLFALTRR